MKSEQKINRRFFVLDFDRTLCDTSYIFNELSRYLEEQHPDLSKGLNEERSRIEETGGSLDVMEALLSIDENMARRAIMGFIDSVDDSSKFLLPGADELLTAIANTGDSWGIMTFGGRAWQVMKLKLLGFNVDEAIILESKGKGRQIGTWRKDGIYQIPSDFGGGIAHEVILVDDKAVEFLGLPLDGARGYMVRDSREELLVSQRGDLPVNVRVIHNLIDIIKYERLS